MLIQVFSTYQQQSNEPLMCMDTNHLVPLITALNNEDDIYLYCLECNYKLFPGYNLYKKLMKKVYYFDK
jgi:hypothetical protein